MNFEKILIKLKIKAKDLQVEVLVIMKLVCCIILLLDNYLK